MPTYDYYCEACDYHFEKFQSITAEPLKACPRCKGEVKRLIGAGTGLIFKGSGFYITDYKNKSGESKTNGSDSSSKSGEKQSSSKKESAKS